MRILFTILFALASLTAWSQPQGRPEGPGVAGRIVDKDNNPIPYVTVALYSLPDSTLTDGTTTNERGGFFLSTKPGSYYIKASFLSYGEYQSDVITVESQPVFAGSISLQPAATSLGEVTVEGERAEMELMLDKRVFNVNRDPNNLGRNVLEIMDNIPSVTVDVDGNVQLRGSGNVRILIDGKPSGLVGAGGSDALRQLQGSMIESIEIITNPSARYEAEGEVGIINIILKKERRDGFNGSFDVNAGWPENLGGGFNMNYRKNRVNLFTSVSANYRQSPGRGSSVQSFALGDSIFSYERTQDRLRGGLSNNFQFGSDFYLNDRNIITTALLYRISDNLNQVDLTYRDFDGNDNLLRDVIRTEEEDEASHDVEISASYRKTFPQEGRTFTIDLRRNISDDTEMADLREFALDDPAYPDITQRSSNVEDERTWLLQSDYVHPFGRGGKFETGWRSTVRIIENDFLVEQLSNGDDWSPLPAFDNFFIYRENIHAGYVQAGNKFGKVSVQAGLRAEFTGLETELVDAGTINPREFFNLFPSANIGYEMKQGRTLQFSYSRRINRPGFRSLLPFFGFSDSRNFFSGNPDLNPEFSHSLETNFIQFFGKGSIFASAYYRHRSNVIERITLVDSTGFARIFPINLSTENNYGAELTVSYRPATWWSMNGNVNFYRAITDGTYENQDFFRDTYTWTARMMSKWTVKKKYDLQATFFYRAPQLTTQGRSLSLASLDLAASRDVLAGNGTLSARVSDVFNSRRFRWTIDTPEYQFTSDFQWRVRQFMVSFNYRINQKKKRGGRPEGDFDMDDMSM